ncbi:MAG: UDP-glucose 4-epimerase GalE [Clostridium sp.]|uniref:UDP-glucose 4-epimerase GalE n=1 Tax=Clostridium sp. TaxID=1506 RepID=UPI002FC8B37D
MGNILVTGGIGYIGSHTVLSLIKEGNKVVILDNLCNSNIKIKEKLEIISGEKLKFYEVDLLNYNSVKEVFNKEEIESVIHFAALKAVGESVKKPLEYYNNNLVGTINLLRVMIESNVKNIIFSSSATVYGDSKVMPVHEELPLLPATNPYGRTKVMIEDILRDVYKADKSFNIILLRYFNPVGAHESGLIGELPNGIPSNLMPYISKVANGELECVNVYGDDYETVDGTGVRDYIHVCDLADGHVAAVKKMREKCGLKVYNLGTGNGYSVLQIINAFKRVTGKDIPYKVTKRRDGDIGTCYANAEKAMRELNWTARREIDDMCKDFWRWQQVGMKKL